MTLQVSTQFYNQSSRFTQHSNVKKLKTWETGGTVNSTVHAIGLISVEGIDDLLNGLKLRPSTPMLIDTVGHTDRDLERRLQPVRTAFLELVQKDIDRSDVRTATLQFGMELGYHTRDQVALNRWHTDGFTGVRWTVAWGPPGSTRGAQGRISEEEVTDITGFVSARLIGPGKRLQPLIFPVGTVVRFDREGDIHAGPATVGPRLFMRADLDIR